MTSTKLTIFIGFDPVESISFYTLIHSITHFASQPVFIVPLNIRNLNSHFYRERDPKQSNEFSFTRFLVPYLMDFQGWALFMDCDMMLREDIFNIFEEIKNQEEKAVYVVKHDYDVKEGLKYLNTVQYSYPRKNWSSFVLWNCGHKSNKKVTQEWVNVASGLELHRFTWLDDTEIGELNIRWNWLVGEYKNPPDNVANVHWTLGGPYFNEFKDVDFNHEWFEMKDKMIHCSQII
ncbi:MAG: hypothetical protein KA270_03280 [Saprospiraceae bacterium]|nr:glycosyltransferase [Saprospiraceae bacterium]MBP6237798.1 hypothetical protein [Saprospiraceae bacterium]MBP6566161.1 hypothetical protein [Saprospiraceae bacterium]